MLVHICCSVDSHYFIAELKKLYPNEQIIGYFYDPNIHPYSEFLLRFQDVKRSCKKLGVKVICGEYEYEEWLKGTNGLENEPEKGKRCEYCFDFRVGNSAKIALELGCKKITTTLLMSPKKDFTQLENALNNAIKGTNLDVIIDGSGEFTNMAYSILSVEQGGAVGEILASSYKVYPNPVKDILTIKGDSMSQIMIYNSLGQLVKSIEGNNDNTVEVNVKGLQNGMYFVNIINDNGKLTAKKVIVE